MLPTTRLLSSRKAILTETPAMFGACLRVRHRGIHFDSALSGFLGSDCTGQLHYLVCVAQVQAGQA